MTTVIISISYVLSIPKVCRMIRAILSQSVTFCQYPRFVVCYERYYLNLLCFVNTQGLSYDKSDIISISYVLSIPKVCRML